MRRIIQRIIVGVVVALVVAGVSVAVNAVQAHAIAAPPNVLGECDMGQMEATDRGGWDLRTFTSRETDDEAYDDPVRPRVIQLAEPCVSDGKWAVPVQLSEIVHTEYDPDDPESQPGAGSSGHCDYRLKTAGGFTPEDWDGYLVGCDQLSVPVNGTFGPYTLGDIAEWMEIGSVVRGGTGNRTVTVTLTGTYPTYVGGLFNLNYTLLCRQDSNPANWTASSGSPSQWGNTAPSLTLVASCSSGWSPWGAYNGYRDYAGDPTGTHRRGGLFWRADGGTEVGSPGLMLGWQSSMTVWGNTEHLSGLTSQLVCAPSREGAEFTIPIDSAYYFGSPWDSNAYSWGVPEANDSADDWRRVDLTFPASGGTAAACPYLARIDATMCTYQVRAVPSCGSFSWTVTKWTSHPEYNDGDPDDWNCVSWDQPICDLQNWPEFQDYGTYADACPNPPTPVWLDFSWLPDFIGYHAQCLFVPKGGMDSGNWVSDAWQGSAGGEVSEVLDELGASFQYSTGCGVVLTMAEPLPMTIDTCAWTWAEPIKVVIGIGMVIGFGLWALVFIWRTAQGLMGHKMPSPVEETDE